MQSALRRVMNKAHEVLSAGKCNGWHQAVVPIARLRIAVSAKAARACAADPVSSENR
jgi:hypothetical protein